MWSTQNRCAWLDCSFPCKTSACKAWGAYYTPQTSCLHTSSVGFFRMHRFCIVCDASTNFWLIAVLAGFLFALALPCAAMVLRATNVYDQIFFACLLVCLVVQACMRPYAIVERIIRLRLHVTDFGDCCPRVSDMRCRSKQGMSMQGTIRTRCVSGHSMPFRNLVIVSDVADGARTSLLRMSLVSCDVLSFSMQRCAFSSVRLACGADWLALCWSCRSGRGCATHRGAKARPCEWLYQAVWTAFGGSCARSSTCRW